MSTFFIAAALVALILLAARSVIRQKKRGGCSGCPGGCSHHSPEGCHCHHGK